MNNKLQKNELLKREKFNTETEFELHIQKELRQFFQIEEELFSLTGNLILVNYTQVLKLSEKLNKIRKQEEKINPGYLNAIGLIDEIYHYVISLYEEKFNPNVLNRAIAFLKEKLNEDNFKFTITEFLSSFPPLEVYKNVKTIDEYLNNGNIHLSNWEITLQELILLYFSNINPAFFKVGELFKDDNLKLNTKYLEIIKLLEEFFENEVKLGDDNLSLINFLKEPLLKYPHNIEKQLEFIKTKWGIVLPEELLQKLLMGIDVVNEELKYFDNLGKGAFVSGAQTFVPIYKMGDKFGADYDESSVQVYHEYEKFTNDINWMPKVVLIAKNIYVWLDQLSKKYGRTISKLSDIPNEELDLLAKWGFTGLWLIGIWERSTASRKIKNYTGNTEATSSAYSLYDYVISNELGGEDAYKDLDYRAASRGIRLACDMVPNHTGIYSKWIVEHPDYFIQLDYPPYPNYSFTGPDLSEDHSISVKIEDGYWSRRDAAVVFKREDKRTGEVRYIYHGNDGTNMPWNDTAQLNFLKKEVREAVIQNILSVARRFSIIRFDAAMTLTKKHYQRLWFPQPGTGGDIPSRAGQGLSNSSFNSLFPEEFWREVVDRINAEMPNVLLLAEAFWLMEGYFVRTLGMHRVYNSAFMHMLMKEENSKYREAIKNTIEFNPEILKRYVNFLSNPDEETAIRQFGDGVKYFGICMLMVTLPGLPMFAHGQIEGYHEKYGMEYKKSYYNENINFGLVRRHEAEIFPLMKKRELFSQVEHFEFYDFVTQDGLDENVFAYSNRSYNQVGLVFYNNKYSETSGWIKISSLKLNNENKSVYNKNIGDALGLKNSENHFYIFKDFRSKMEFLRNGKEIFEKGFYIFLRAYQYYIFTEIFEVYDESGDFRKLYYKLDGRSCLSVEEEIYQIKLTPVHSEFFNLLKIFSLNNISNWLFTSSRSIDTKDILKETTNLYIQFIYRINAQKVLPIILSSSIHSLRDKIIIITSFIKLLNFYFKGKIEKGKSKIFTELDNFLLDKDINLPISLFKIYLKSIFIELKPSDSEFEREIFDELRLEKAISDYLENNQIRDNILLNTTEFLRCDKVLLVNLSEEELKIQIIKIFDSQKIYEIIGVNEYMNTTYFNKELFEQFLFDFTLCNIFNYIYYEIKTDKMYLNWFIENKNINSFYKIIAQKLNKNEKQFIFLSKYMNKLSQLAKQCSYKYEEFIKLLYWQ